MITVDKLSKTFGSRTLFENVTVTFNAGNRYGLTGPNGAGKSTFLRILTGSEDATGGTVSLPDRVGFLKQNIEAFRDFRLLDAVIIRVGHSDHHVIKSTTAILIATVIAIESDRTFRNRIITREYQQFFR